MFGRSLKVVIIDHHLANEQQIIIAADVTDQANDVRQTVPMMDQTIANLDDAGVTENIKALTADAGYFSEDNMDAVDSNERIDDAFIATGRQKHNDKVPDAPKGRPPKDLTPKQKMARRNRTQKGEWKLVCLTHNLLKLFRSGALATS